MLNARTQAREALATNEAHETKGGAVQNGRLPSPNMISRTIYKEGLDGEVIRQGGKVHRASRELEDFDTRMKNNLYQAECDGTRFAPGEKQWLKQASWFNK